MHSFIRRFNSKERQICLASMEAIASYESDSAESDFENKELGRRQVRQVYLVTYSQADTETFPTRESFAKAVIASFQSCSVLHWCCSKENHKTSGFITTYV